MGRTGGYTWNQIRLAGCRINRFIHQGAGGTDRDAGRAEFAARILEGFSNRAHLHLSIFIKNETERLDAAQIATGPHTAGAANTQIIISFKQGVIFENRKIGGHPSGCCIRDADIVGHLLQLTVPEQIAAALSLRHIGGTGRQRASVLLGTGQAGVAMAGHDRQQVITALFPYTLI